MSKKFFYIILIFNAIALIGVFLTQIYWVREAYNLKENQIDNSIRLAMKEVASQLLDSQLQKIQSADQDSSSEPVRPDVRNIDPSLLDLKISEQFSMLKIQHDYEYGILDRLSENIVLGKHKNFSSELFSKGIEIPLIGFKDPSRYTLSVFFPRQNQVILSRMLNWLFFSALFSIILLVGFYLTIYFFQKQKKLSEMKTSFINNMTHEFKTPISVISLASELILKPEIYNDPSKLLKYGNIIYDENSRMKAQVDQILKVSNLVKSNIELKLEKIDVHELIIDIVANFELAVKQKDGEIITELMAEKKEIIADRFHITNIIMNLLDNANKYSPGKPLITVSTRNNDKGILISVQDHGIGISQANQKNIFMNLFRVSTGNVHDVRGFGIGLYYVKTYVEAHGGKINLESELSKGSRFTVYLPFRTKLVSNDDKEQG